MCGGGGEGGLLKLRDGPRGEVDCARADVRLKLAMLCTRGQAWALLYFGNKTDAQQHLAPLLDPELSKDGGCYHAFESIPRYYLYTKSLPIAHDRASKSI